MTVDDPTLEAARANAEAMIRDEPAITLERFAPDAFVDTSITIVLGSDPLELIAAAAEQIATWTGTPPLRVVADHEVYLSQPAVLTDVVVRLCPPTGR